ncbi:hypothetical protein Tco_0588035 [Tanacetum coccineum]
MVAPSFSPILRGLTTELATTLCGFATSEYDASRHFDELNNDKRQQQLALDEEALRETLEEEARAEKERARAEKEREEEIKKEQAHDELFRLEFEVMSDS